MTVQSFSKSTYLYRDSNMDLSFSKFVDIIFVCLEKALAIWGRIFHAQPIADIHMNMNKLKVIEKEQLWIIWYEGKNIRSYQISIMKSHERKEKVEAVQWIMVRVELSIWK